MGLMRGLGRCLVAIVALAPAALAGTEDSAEKARREALRPVLHGAPADASDDWLLAAGGRIYDRWWKALDRPEPKETHPSYPASGAAKGAGTWRCKECHGWDYRGRDGAYATGRNATGITGIRSALGKSPAEIIAVLRAPLHGYTAEMMSDDELARVAAFVSRGQDDVAAVIEPATRSVNGDAARGKSLFQTVCATCHGFDGRAINLGRKDKPSYLGAGARRSPEEVLHKIRNGHAGETMPAMRSLPLADAAAILAYSRSLPDD